MNMMQMPFMLHMGMMHMPPVSMMQMPFMPHVGMTHVQPMGMMQMPHAPQMMQDTAEEDANQACVVKPAYRFLDRFGHYGVLVFACRDVALESACRVNFGDLFSYSPCERSRDCSFVATWP